MVNCQKNNIKMPWRRKAVPFEILVSICFLNREINLAFFVWLILTRFPKSLPTIWLTDVTVRAWQLVGEVVKNYYWANLILPLCDKFALFVLLFFLPPNLLMSTLGGVFQILNWPETSKSFTHPSYKMFKKCETFTQQVCSLGIYQKY